MTRRASREVAAFDADHYTLRFADGLTVNTTTCPRSIHARSHWNADGTCACPNLDATPPGAAEKATTP